MTTETWGANEVGCVFDSHHGIYIYRYIQELAKTIGWPGAVERTDSDQYTEAADEAETWLNENVAEEGFAFGWFDGDYFFQSDEWWQQDS